MDLSRASRLRLKLRRGSPKRASRAKAAGFGLRDSQRRRIPNRESRITTAAATAFYAALTIALTWPLARGLTRDLPGDLGDPLFVSWVLAWDATHLGRGLWNANIFHPHPLALAYSEHFLPQAIQILPVYALTKNPILCYNLIFLSTFVLSGLGMFLFAREVTGSGRAGVIAGLAYAFAPYRFAQLAHVQVLSSAWMPFVLFGLRRYFTTNDTRPLIGAAAAWVVQNLSCGYYLLFFSLLVVLYLAWEITSRRLWISTATILRVAALCGSVALTTVPFVLPYLQLRRHGMAPRSMPETIRFSADVYAYLTAAPGLWIVGPLMRAWPKSEGLLFPGFTITALAAVAVVAAARQSRRRAPAADRPALRVFVGTLWWLLAVSCVALVGLLFGWTLRLPGLRITSVARAAWITLALSAGLFAVSARARAIARDWLASPVGFFSGVTLFAVVMSFGPEIHAKGRAIAAMNLYALFYNYVPGFDGLRVPARFAMIVALGLAVLAGWAVRAIELAGWRRLSAVAAVLIVLEALAVPLMINYTSADYEQAGLAPLPGLDADVGHEVYLAVANLPESAALVELPLGEPAFDIRYMFHSTRHWKRLVNGYSGSAPTDYGLLDQSLRELFTRPEQAWLSLRDSRATHVVVHEAFYADDRGPRVSDWLRTHGAAEVGAFGRDRLFRIE